MSTIFEFSAENAKIADSLAERRRFEFSGDFEEGPCPTGRNLEPRTC